MRRKRFAPAKIISMLREAEVGLSQGLTVGKVCRRLEISEQTYYRPPAPEAIMPLYFDPFWLSSSQENIAQILT